MKTLIAYKTKLGSSKKYATWLGESIGAEVVDFDEAAGTDWNQVSRVVVFSGTYGGRMPLTKFLKNNWSKLADKKVVAVGLGAISPDKAWSRFAHKLIPKNIRENIKYFKLPGNIGQEITETEARSKLAAVTNYLND